jgi:translocation and assembly module TamB
VTTPAPGPATWRAAPLRTAAGLLAPLLWVALLLALALLAALGVVLWLFTNEGGTRWLLERLPAVEASGTRGALLGEQFEAERLTITLGGGAALSIEGLSATGMQWAWQPQQGAWFGLQARSLGARRVAWRSASGPTQLTVPASLAVPFQLEVGVLSIGELRIDDAPPLRSLSARIALSAQGGELHRADDLEVEVDRVRISAAARVGSRKPFALEGAARIEPLRSDDAWSGELRASGTLERVTARASLRGSPRAGHDAPALDFDAQILPFAPWPIAALAASTKALDLAALASAAPTTRLSGTAVIQSRALDAPIAAQIRLDNAAAGRWNDGRLPARRIELDLSGSIAERNRVDIRAFDLQLGGPNGEGGRWRGSGAWRDHSLQLSTALADLRPQHLDGRAAALAASGPLELAIAGLPSPDPGAPAPNAPLTVEVKSTLDGRLDAAPVPVRLALDALLGAGRIELRQLRVASGAAVAQLQAIAVRSGAAWQLKSEGSLVDFDPLPWWPGPEGSAWRQGPHRLSGLWQFDLRLPHRAPALPAFVQAIVGSGRLRISESVLAGVPLQALVTLGQSAAGSARNTLHGELQLAVNRLSFEGEGDPLGSGQSDKFRAELKAEALEALAPVLRLLPVLGPWLPRQGGAEAQISGEGRWPDVRTIGRASVAQLRAGGLALDKGRATWRFDTASDQPLAAKVELDGATLAERRVRKLSADLKGTLREHSLSLDAAVDAGPPEATRVLLGSAAGGTQIQLQAAGSWSGSAATGGTWRGHVARLLAAPSADAKRSWLSGRDLRGEVSVNERAEVTQVRAEPGRVLLADDIALRWDEFQLDKRGRISDLRLRGEIEAFAAAPLLARLQPHFGWGGNLVLAGRIDVKAAERFDADIVFERKSGDLHLEENQGRQTFGLSALRLALNAHDGTWYFTQALAGTAVGELGGALSLRMNPAQRWPTRETPMDGVLEARVANLGVWATWVPPGWRLSGTLTTSAAVKGTVGKPDYSGRVLGSGIAVRNLLQGVDVSGGEVDIALAGAAAKIERFGLRAGDGTLNVTGSADLGLNPSAQLKFAADRLRVLGRIDRQLVMSGGGDLALRLDQIKLDGALKIDEGLFDVSRSDAPSLDDDVTIRTNGTEEADADQPEAPRRPRRNLQVELAVNLGDKLHVRGRGLDTMLAGKLRITTPGGRLAVNGEVRAEGGTYAAYGQKLEIERGILTFTGPADNPRLDILALRPNIDTRVGVAIAGSFVTPRVRLYADPEMGDTEKLSWLVLGRPSEGLGRADTTLLQRAAVALLAGEGEAPTDTLMRALGLTEFSLRQSEGEVRETVITLGKQLSRRWYVGYERGVNAATGTWQLIYRIAQRFTLRAQSGHENALDVIWVWRVGEPAAPAAPKPVPPQSASRRTGP